jgi:hypothetical protein
MNLNPVLTKFLNKQNLKLLWEVLLDELHIDSNNKSIITNIRTVFESNIQPFTKNTSIHANMQLTNLNKQFLSQVLFAVNRLFPNLKQEQDFKRIQISSEEISSYKISPYKIEDIREVRQDTFEKQVSIKQADFDNYINLNKPKELDFSEKMEDDKITEMDALIAETVARRKFDIEQIQNTIVTEDPENWLQSQKITNTNTNTNTNVKEAPSSDLSIYRKLKLKQINENIVINTTANQKKNVTWDDENNFNNISLLIEEIQEKQEIPTDKVDILINKVDILIDLMTKVMTKVMNKDMNKDA